MFWSLTFQMLPGEEVIDDSTRKDRPAVKPAYSVFLTNKRAIFRFDGLGSSLSQTFFYREIIDVRPIRRLFFSYLQLKTAKREYLLNTSDCDYWAAKLMEIKKSVQDSSPNSSRELPVSPERRKRELLDMLTVLRKNNLLTDRELDEKVQLLDSMKL